jgi:hypothetical protein
MRRCGVQAVIEDPGLRPIRFSHSCGYCARMETPLQRRVSNLKGRLPARDVPAGANAQFRRRAQAIENDAIAGTDSFAIWCRGSIKAGHEMLDQDYLASCDHNVANSIVATGAHLSRTTQGSSVRIFSRAFRKFNASRGVQSPS